MKKLIAEIIDKADNTVVSIDKNIMSLNFEQRTRGDASSALSYGIYSQGGKVVFVDNVGDFKRLYQAIQTTPTRLQKVIVNIYNSIDGVKTKIHSLYLEDIEHERETNQYTLTLTDNLTSWQNISMPEIVYFVTKSALDILQYRFFIANISNYKVSELAKNFMEQATVYCPIFEKGNLWDQITKICQISCCYIFYENGIIRIIHEDDMLGERVNLLPSKIFNIRPINSFFKTSLRNISLKTKFFKKSENTVYYRNTIEIYNNIHNIISTGASRTYDWDYIGDTVNSNNDTNINRTLSGNFDIEFVNNQVYSQTLDFTITIPSNERNITDILYDEYMPKFVFKGNVFTDYTAGPSSNATTTFETLEITPEYTIDNTGALTVTFSYQTLYRNTDESGLGNYRIVQNILIYVYASYWKDLGDDELSTSSIGLKDFEIPSNELMQTYNTYMNDYAADTGLLRAVEESYGKGFDVIEVECVYMPNLQNFQCVVPYISQKGNIVPYMTDANGETVVYKIVGIDYEYDGFARQKLYLQSLTPPMFN